MSRCNSREFSVVVHWEKETSLVNATMLFKVISIPGSSRRCTGAGAGSPRPSAQPLSAPALLSGSPVKNRCHCPQSRFLIPDLESPYPNTLDASQQAFLNELEELTAQCHSAMYGLVVERHLKRNKKTMMKVSGALTCSLRSFWQLWSLAVTSSSVFWEVVSCCLRSVASLSRLCSCCLRRSSSWVRAASFSSRTSSCCRQDASKKTKKARSNQSACHQSATDVTQRAVMDRQGDTLTIERREMENLSY